MKTDQLMTVRLGKLGELKIRHKSEIGSLIDIFTAGNRCRHEKGLKAIRHDQWLALQGTKDFIAEVHNRLNREVLITKRGKGGGIWAHLYILLDAAAYLSPELKFAVYETFVKSKLLEWRDRSGQNFIELNATIALNAEEVFGKPSHTGHYINISKIIKSRCDADSWNTATPEQLNQRARMEEALATMLRLGVVKDWAHLKALAQTV